MNFSQRIGITEISKPMQVDSIDEDLSIGLWNVIKIQILDRKGGLKTNIKCQNLMKMKLKKDYTSLNGANIHLTKALSLLSDRNKPDYRNSIKEPISAVEATCKPLTGISTLDKDLSKMNKSGIHINGQLKSGFEKIYTYSNQGETGIRHRIDTNYIESEFSDVQFMLVSCSAFINYLVLKSKKAKN